MHISALRVHNSEVVIKCTFQHFVFTIVRLIDLLIPDVPEKLEALIHLEDSFAREMMKEVIEVTTPFILILYYISTIKRLN